MTARFFAAVCAVLISFSIISCGGSEDAPKSATEGFVTIVYSGNVGAETEPCGCRIPEGGFARRATVLDSLRGVYDNLLVLDSGGMLYPWNYIYPPHDVTSPVVADLIVDLLDELKFDAINVSSFDLALGPDSLLAYSTTMNTKWLSSNIVWEKSGERIFTPDVTYDVNGLKVSVFGLIDQLSRGMIILGDNSPAEVTDPFAAAREEVEKFKSSDVVIGLFNMDLDRVKELVVEVPGIDLVIMGHTLEHKDSNDILPPMKVGNTVIARCADGGRVIGKITLIVKNGGTDFIDATQRLTLQPGIEKDTDLKLEQSSYVNAFYTLDPKIPSVESIKERVEKVERWKDAYLDSVRTAN